MGGRQLRMDIKIKFRSEREISRTPIEKSDMEDYVKTMVNFHLLSHIQKAEYGKQRTDKLSFFSTRTYFNVPRT